MHVIWRGGILRGGKAQWVFFGAIAAVIGLAAFVLVALGLVVAVLLVGIFCVATALASRRRGGIRVYAARTVADGREPEGDYVELGQDAYTVRVVGEKQTPV
jgi:hypothetical protein